MSLSTILIIAIIAFDLILLLFAYGMNAKVYRVVDAKLRPTRRGKVIFFLLTWTSFIPVIWSDQEDDDP